jgi:collagenase-like PrtC family protease
MNFSVAYTFDASIISKLARFPEVHEIYGKLDRDIVGGGRSAYTLSKTSRSDVAQAVKEAHSHNIAFNYLLNGATLNGIEQTRSGQREIRCLLDWLAGMAVDSVTVASPYLLRLVKTQYPQFKVRVSVFAMVDSPGKARQWQDLGADTICVSAVACNRDFKRLENIRNATACELQLIVNASCLLNCAYELTHMNLLTQSSRKKDPLGGFCLDYCFLYCSAKKLRETIHYLRSTWIRPEDLKHYRALGYSSFKIVERSCPSGLLLKRVAAYARRSFDGNLLELVGPVANIKKEQGASLIQRARIIATMFKPSLINVNSLIQMKRYAKKIILHDYSPERAPIYIDNRKLDGFIEGIKTRDCDLLDCRECGYCRQWADQIVQVDPTYRAEMLALATELDNGLTHSTHWLDAR